MSFPLIISLIASFVTIVIGIFQVVHIVQTHPGEPKEVWVIVGITAIVAVLIVVGGYVASFILSNSNTPHPTPHEAEVCPVSTGVTLYVDANYKGHCHTFPPGTYDLSQFGLDGNVSSLRDPNAKYHITLRDKSGRPGYFDHDEPILPADWIDQSHTMLVEAHKP